HQARQLLLGSTADSKNIVLLSDGEPTRSYALKNTSAGSGNFIGGNPNYTRDDLDESAFNYNVTVGSSGSMTSQIQGNRYYHHGNSAVAESRFAKAAGYTMYSISLDAGSDGNNVLGRIASTGKA